MDRADNWLMSFANNPVERLELVALRMREASDGTPLLHGLVQVLNVNTVPEIMRGAIHLMALPGQARDAVKLVDTDPFYLEWFDPVTAAVATTQNLDRASADFKVHLTESVVANIRAAARRCAVSYGQDDVLSEISEIRAQCDSWGQSIHDASDLPPELKRFLIAQVDRLTVALGEFTIRGEEAVHDVADAVTGAVIRATNAFPDNEWPTASQSFMQRILSMVDSFGAVATTSTAVLMLPSAVSNAIGYLT